MIGQLYVVPRENAFRNPAKSLESIQSADDVEMMLRYWNSWSFHCYTSADVKAGRFLSWLKVADSDTTRPTHDEAVLAVHNYHTSVSLL